MKKNLISMAVAAAMIAPGAAMAEAILYGKLHVSIDYADVKNAASLPVFARDGRRLQSGVDFKGWGVSRNGTFMPGEGRSNRVGVKGSEDLGNGLKAIYQVELGIEFGSNNLSSNANTIGVRNSFVGLAGGFGTVLVGRHDTPLKISTGRLDMFADTMADYNGTVGFDDLRVDNAIAYISPSFSGFQFMGALVAPGGGTAGYSSPYSLGVGGNAAAIDLANNANWGSGAQNVNSDQLNGAYSLAAMYANGPFFGSLAFESLSNEMFMNSGTSRAGSAACRLPNGQPTPSCSYVGDDYDKWRIGLGILDWNGFTLSGVYEDWSNVPGGQMWGTFANQRLPLDMKSQKLWQIQAGYAFGNNQIKAMYGQAQRDYKYNAALLPVGDVATRNQLNATNGDRNTWAIAFDHNFSKRTSAYVLYTDVSDDMENYVQGSTWSGFSLGMIHSF